MLRVAMGRASHRNIGRRIRSSNARGEINPLLPQADADGGRVTMQHSRATSPVTGVAGPIASDQSPAGSAADSPAASSGCRATTTELGKLLRQL
jgi:hypothetical protein